MKWASLAAALLYEGRVYPIIAVLLTLVLVLLDGAGLIDGERRHPEHTLLRLLVAIFCALGFIVVTADV